MKAEQTTTLIWVLAAVAAIGAVVVAVLFVRQQDGDSDQLSDEAEIFEEIFGSQFPEGAFDEQYLDERVAEFESFEEAEERAGYDILRPSDDFVLLGGVTYIETFLPDDRGAPASRSEYISPDGERLTFQVFPWNPLEISEFGGRDTRTIGSKEGWTFAEDENDYFFAWDCGTPNSTELVCTVFAEPDIDQGTFEYFVETLR